MLLTIMEFEPSNEEKFLGTPTLLPFSPFTRPKFSFSISNTLLKKTPNDILFISIHEISHFILFDILKDLKISFSDTSVKDDLLYILKEALASALLSEPDMLKLLGNGSNRIDYRVHTIFVAKNGKEKIRIVEYLRAKFREYKLKNMSFKDYIEDICNELIPQAEQFSNKVKIWKKYGNDLKLISNQEICIEYEKPIII